MDSLRFILRSLVYYRRTHAGVVAGAAIATAVLTGALLLGSSVRHTLREQALDRIGSADAVLTAGDRFFNADLADRFQQTPEVLQAAPILQLRSVVSTPATGQTVQRTQILGVDDRFAQFARNPLETLAITGSQCLLNARLANQLNASPGDELNIRVRSPDALAADSVLGSAENALRVFRVVVAGVLQDESFGRYSLSADQVPPSSLFVSIGWLQEQLELPGRANILLLDTSGNPSAQDLATSLGNLIEAGDYQLQASKTSDPAIAAYKSDRIFIGSQVEQAAASSDVAATGVLTYFVNAFEFADRLTPYSMVSAIGPLDPLGTDLPGYADQLLPENMADTEIVINDWLQSDLGCNVGDTISLRYFVTDDRDRLFEQSADFTVRSVIPMQGVAADETLMPDFPGISEAEAERDWDPGIPLELGLLRDKDEQYWDDHRGTPKAFVTLNAGKAMWKNRYGSLTSIQVSREHSPLFANAISNSVDPESLGFSIQDIRLSALKASQAATDFGGLFLALSFFIIFAALMLMGLLFMFNIEQRARELGTIVAMGFTRKAAGRLLWIEGTLLATIGAAIGSIAGVGYTKLVLAALSGIWRGAVASASIQLHISPITLLIGFASSLIAAALVMRLTLWRMTSKPIVNLLAGEIESTPKRHTGTGMPIVSAAIGACSVLAALSIVTLVGASSQSGASAFFGAGALLLIGCIALSRVVVFKLGQSAGNKETGFAALAIRNTARRLNRSTATISLLAFGVFLVVGVSGSQLDPNRQPEDRSSGTGGFAFIGETTLPVSHDLNETSGRDAFGLSENELADVSFIPLRMRDGDDASCLNLNLPQNPKLLGVDPHALASRDSFTFVKTLADSVTESQWMNLAQARADGAIPAIADDTSATWSMHKAVGDSLEYTNERGEPVSVIIVATIANSILQGNLLISEDNFRDLFPSEHGGRLLLIDAPEKGRDALAARLSSSLSDVGLELTPAAQRLADYSAVQNTYLVIFQMLGALGLLLGTLGLGVVVVRNLLERRAELAMLRVVGFSLAQVRQFVVTEHALLLVLGLICGSLAALVALIPSILSETVSIPILFVVLLLVTLLLSGLVWIWLATRVAVSDSIVRDLQGE